MRGTHGALTLTDDEERGKDTVTWNLRLTALLVIRSSVLYAPGMGVN